MEPKAKKSLDGGSKIINCLWNRRIKDSYEQPEMLVVIQGFEELTKKEGRATEEGSLFQEGQTSNRCCMCTKEQQNEGLQIALTKYMIQIVVYAKCVDPGVDWAT